MEMSNTKDYKIEIRDASIYPCNKAYKEVYRGLYTLEIAWTSNIGFGLLDFTFYEDGHWECEDEMMSDDFCIQCLIAYFKYVRESENNQPKLSAEDELELLDRYNKKVEELK